MRILEIITPSRLGGAERYLGWLVQEFEQLGHEVLLGVRPCPVVEAFYRELGIPYRSMAISGKLNLRAQGRIEAVIDHFKPDVVHTHLSTASTWGLRAAAAKGIPGVGHVHANNTAGPYRKAAHLVTVSASVRDYIAEQGLDPARCEIIHPASLVRGAVPAPDITALGDSVISCAARLHEDKGVRVLFEAFKIVSKTRRDATLVYCGDGPLRAPLQRAAAGLPVHFVGYRPDVPSVFAASAVSALVSTRPEGYGLSLIESQAVGTPVIAADAGGAVEAMIDGTTGIAVPMNDPKATARAILSLLGDSDLRQRVGEAGKEFAKTRTVRRSAEQLVALFERLAVRDLTPN